MRYLEFADTTKAGNEKPSKHRRFLSFQIAQMVAMKEVCQRSFPSWIQTQISKLQIAPKCIREGPNYSQKNKGSRTKEPAPSYNLARDGQPSPWLKCIRGKHWQELFYGDEDYPWWECCLRELTAQKQEPQAEPWSSIKSLIVSKDYHCLTLWEKEDTETTVIRRSPKSSPLSLSIF